MSSVTLSLEQEAEMTEWLLRRWVRFGHDRLYAETPGGTKLGYQDLATGRFHSDDLSNLPILRAAVAEYFGAPVTGPASMRRGTAVARPAQTTASPEWSDLSLNRPGAAARERALEERAAQGRLRHAVARFVGAKTDERAWRIGADGEEAVAAQLARLGPRWRVLHAVEVGDRGSDIDHIVIGPGGVFTLNAKHHPNAKVWVGGETFMVNGRRVPYVRNSRHEAQRAMRLLTEHTGFPVRVRGLVVVMGAHRGLTLRKQPDDGAVVVTARRGVAGYLAKQKPLLAEREVDAIFDIARRSTTWRGA